MDMLSPENDGVEKNQFRFTCRRPCIALSETPFDLIIKEAAVSWIQQSSATSSVPDIQFYVSANHGAF